MFKASHTYFMRSPHIMYDITCIVFLTSLPLYLTLHPLYLFHQDQCINYATPTLCMTSHTLYVWQHSQYAWHNMNTLGRHTCIVITSHTVYLWHHNHIYDINATAFMKTQQLYLTSHPLYLTSQPLYLCSNTRCSDAITTIMEVIPLGTRMTSYTLYMTSQSHFMTSFLSIYDITATAFMTSDPLHMTSPTGFMTSRPLYMWHHRHYVNIYQLYLTSNTRCRDNTTTIPEITTSICVSVWSHTLYRWYNTHFVYDMATNIFMAEYALYMTSHPWFMTS